MKKIYLLISIIAFIVVTVFSQCSRDVSTVIDSKTGEEYEQLRIDVPNTETTISPDRYANVNFSGEDIQFLCQIGEPNLPYSVIKVLLPPDAILSTVSMHLKDKSVKELTGSVNIKPVGPVAFWDDKKKINVVLWPKDRTIVDGKDIKIYNNNALYPKKLIGEYSTGELRNWKVTDIPIALYQYNPVVKKLYKLTDIEILIRYKRTSETKSITSGLSYDSIGERRIKKMIINQGNMDEYYKSFSPTTRSPLPQQNSYAIITTSSIVQNSTQLLSFIASKQRRGFTVHVITESQWGGGTGNTAAENIRSWLKNNYLQLSIEYVLLIGSPNPETGDVPMKMTWPRNNATTYLDYKDAPTDFYYADLTGNWDLDGDGFFGEWGNDFESGGVDRNNEVVVGRIPDYDHDSGSYDILDNILTKMINYMEEPQPATWRQNVLLPMVPSDESTPGYHLGEAIKNSILIPKGWGYHRIYNENYGLSPVPETVPCTYDNVKNVWTGSTFGAIFWWTHGYTYYAALVMQSGYANFLDNTHPGFTFQSSCLNSQPEDKYNPNLSYALLKNGAIATIGATRVSWYTMGQTSFAGKVSNAGMTYEYAKRLITNDMDCGYALHDLKQDLAPLNAEFWMNFVVFNIYGDPEMSLSSHSSTLYRTPCYIPGTGTYGQSCCE